jgi:POT family proton-dependent oligopeptide transporter
VFVIMYRVISTTRDEKNRVLAMAVLFFGCLSFFGIFEQAGSTLSFFAEERTRKEIFGLDFPSSYWNFVNAGWVILLAPLFTWLWTFLAKRGKEPFSVNKFAIGMVVVSMAFLPLISASGKDLWPGYLFIYYFFASAAEMCISPVGLSVMNKLAPERLASFVMGVWFLAISIGLYIAGRAEVEVGKMSTALEWGENGVFYLTMIFALAVAGLLALASGPVKRMLERDRPAAKPAA